MKSIRIILLLVCILTVGITVRSQKVQLYTSDGELSSGLINKIMQDSRGFLWVATENGLNQFDGTRFKVFYKEKDNPGSILGNYVHTVHELKDGTILVGCINGLMEYHPDSDTFSEIEMIYKGRKVKAHVFDMLELSTGELWLATAGYGLFNYDRSKRRAFSMDKLTEVVGAEFISSLYEDSTHTIWIGTESKGICRFYPSSNKARNYHTPELSGNFVTSLIEDEDGSILVGTLDGGVDRYSMLTEKFSPIVSDGNVVPSVKSLSQAGGIIYACTDGQGLHSVKDGKLEPVDSKIYLQDKAETRKIHQLLSDKDGNLWINIYQKGLAFIPRNRFKFNNIGKTQVSGNQIGDGCVMSVFVDKGNSIWISCDNNGIYRLDKNGKLSGHYPIKATAMCFMSDSKGRLWSGTYTQGAMILNADGHWQQIPELSDRKIYSFAETKDGEIYVGSLDRGLELFDPVKRTVTDCIGNLRLDRDGTTSNSLNSVNNLHYSKDGRLWVAHYNGISCFDTKDKKFIVFDSAINLIADCIGYAIYEDDKGNMWFGTSEGLFRYEKTSGTKTHYTVDNGLPNNVVSGICEDNDGGIWISTYHGIARLTIDNNEVVSFDSGDGLQGNEFTHGAYFKDEHGVVYFGGTNGVTFFHPSDIENPKYSGDPMITEVGVYTSSGNGSDYKVVLANSSGNSEIKLSYTENTINIFFSTLNYDNPAKVCFEYRIRQNGDNWIKTEAGQNRITFYDLSPGTYDFELRVVGNPAKVANIKIVVTPPWYLSFPAKAFYVLLFILISAMLYRHLRQRSAELEEIERRRQSERVSEAKLELFTNFSHEIRTPMTLIIDPLRKLINGCTDKELLNKYTVIYRNATRILGLVNQLMDVRKIDKGQMRLQARLTDMVGFIEDVMKPFEYYAKENRITLTFNHKMERQDCWIDLEHFDKVFMNLLSNAFKHTGKDGKIDINLSTGKYEEKHASVKSGEYLEIEVRDTGDGILENDVHKIFELFYQGSKKTARISTGTGIGLHLTKLIVGMHKGTITARNRSDRQGAVFTVRIPLGNSHLKRQEMLLKNEHYESKDIDFSLLKVIEEETKSKNKTKSNGTVIIVEDDEEIRHYLKNELNANYRNVASYTDAESAFKDIISMKVSPDVIISDVMMDGMDGITFTRKIKQNAKTNHTPVILLSAKSEPEDIKAGIESGADHYMVKPFSSELLLSTVANLMSNRHLLKVKYSGSQEQEDKIEKIEMKSADEILMTRVMDVINRNIASSEFSVEKLADEVGLSRAHLHRKLKELTNLSSRDFIRSIRMRQAARLLSENDLSIAEVAYATGFANASHFSNVFKEYHGITPTKYAAQEKSAKEEVAGS